MRARDEFQQLDSVRFDSGRERRAARPKILAAPEIANLVVAAQLQFLAARRDLRNGRSAVEESDGVCAARQRLDPHLDIAVLFDATTRSDSAVTTNPPVRPIATVTA